MIDWVIAAVTAGLVIGKERGWRLRGGRDGSRVAGLRTFTLLGTAGGLIALIVQALGALVGAVPLAGLVTVLVLGYARSAWKKDQLDETTLVAALVTAIIGGAYSSTAVTASLAERMHRGDKGPLTAGIVIATAVMYIRISVLVGLLAWPLLQVIGPAMIAAWMATFVAWRRSGYEEESGPAEPARNPIALVPALGFLAAVAGAALLVRWSQASFGESGVAWSLFVAGSFDVDAAIVTLSGLPRDAVAPSIAALAVGGTVAVNMAFKMLVAVVTARR